MSTLLMKALLMLAASFPATAQSRALETQTPPLSLSPLSLKIGEGNKGCESSDTVTAREAAVRC